MGKMRKDKRKNQAVWKFMQFGAAVMLLLLVCIGMQQSAAAEDVLLKVNRVTVYAGDRVILQDYVNEEYQKDAVYEWDGEKPEESLAVMTEDGIVLTHSSGEVKVTVSWQGEKEEETTESSETTEIKKEEILYISMIEPEKISMEYGSMIDMAAADLYEKEEINYAASVDSVEISEKGILIAQGFQNAQIIAIREDETSFPVADVTILEPKLSKDKIVRAVGTAGYQVGMQYFSIGNSASESIQWTIADNSVASWDGVGCKALKKGSTTADIVLTAKNGDQKTLKLEIVVTDPALSKTSIIMAEGTSQKIKVTGTDAASEIIWGDHAGSNAYFSADGVIYGADAGSASLKVTVDGRELICKVKVSDPTYKDMTIIMHKGKSAKLKITGTVKGSVVSYKSSNKNVLTISKTGKMKAKKVGHATVKVKADGRTFSILAEISSKKGYQAMKKAIAISKTKTTYSQARRMSKRYYDCSSLVSRVYRNYGVYFGSPRGWSPTAADIGKWCTRNKKVIAKKAVSYKKLLPGDLIFFSSGKNGRFKNITHIEMYTGGATDVSASSTYGKVVHYGYGTSSQIVLIARPTK